MTAISLITLEELTAWRDEWHKDGAQVVFVPTMGALHEGHLSLVNIAKDCGDKVIVSIFVNPTQFGPNEDFAKYPRTLAEDISLLNAAGADAVFLPNASDIYPEHFQTYVYNNKMADILCGVSRRSHFQGVLTVVLKLFNLIKPHAAIFGKKDYQQWRLIETMTNDLALGVKIVGGDILREKNGLAMSSRNRYLSDVDRHAAGALYKGLEKAHHEFKRGSRDKDHLIDVVKKHIATFSEIRLEYVELLSQKGLQTFDDDINLPCVMLVAAVVKNVRLIDNLEMELNK